MIMVRGRALQRDYGWDQPLPGRTAQLGEDLPIRVAGPNRESQAGRERSDQLPTNRAPAYDHDHMTLVGFMSCCCLKAANAHSEKDDVLDTPSSTNEESTEEQNGLLNEFEADDDANIVLGAMGLALLSSFLVSISSLNAALATKDPTNGVTSSFLLVVRGWGGLVISTVVVWYKGESFPPGAPENQKLCALRGLGGSFAQGVPACASSAFHRSEMNQCRLLVICVHNLEYGGCGQYLEHSSSVGCNDRHRFSATAM